MKASLTRRLIFTIALAAGVVGCTSDAGSSDAGSSADGTDSTTSAADTTSIAGSSADTDVSTQPVETDPPPPTDTASTESGSSDTASTGTDSIDEPDPGATADVIEQVIIDFVETSPGGVDVLFTRGDATLRSTAGAGSVAGEALEPGRPFRVGSISKPFVAVMVMQLVDEMVVDLDAPLGTYLPDTPVGADATIRQLLSHQSGIPSYTDQPAIFSDAFADLTQSLTPTDILSYLDGVPAGQPDRFAYSNTNYILLGQLIEQLDGTDLNTALQQRITGPLALDDTFFDVGNDTVTLPDDLVGGWSPLGGDGDPTAPYQAIASGAWAAGSLISTVDDLDAFISALATDQLVSPESFAEMTDIGSAGYGLGLLRVGFSPTQIGFGHNGSIPGYSSTFAIDPVTGDTLVILTNDDVLIADELAFEILTAR